MSVHTVNNGNQTPTVTWQQRDSSDAKVTAMALSAVALVFFAAACVLWGIGTSPGTMLRGMDFFPYIAGTFCCALSVGVAAGAALFYVKGLIHNCQMQ